MESIKYKNLKLDFDVMKRLAFLVLSATMGPKRRRRQAMVYVGFDRHKSFSYITIVSEKGQIKRQ